MGKAWQTIKKVNLGGLIIIKNSSKILLLLAITFITVSLVSASTDINANHTNKVTKKEDSFNNETSQDNNKLSSQKTDNKNIINTSKHQTKTKHNTQTNGSHFILKTSVTSDIPVNEGYVIYKINGVTLRNSSNNIYKVNVHNSQASISVPVSSYKNIILNSMVIYSGSKIFDESRDFQKNTGLTKYSTKTNLNTFSNRTHIVLKANINSDIPVYGGHVIYKLDKISLKNAKKEVYKVNVVNSTATLILPISTYRKIYSNSEAKYSGNALFNTSNYLNNNTINNRLNPIIKTSTNQTSYIAGQNVLLNVKLSSDEIKNFTNGKVVLKINGITQKNNLNNRIKNDNINLTYTIPRGYKYNTLNINALSEGSTYNKIISHILVPVNATQTRIEINKFFVDNNNYCIFNASIKDSSNKNIVGKTFLDLLVDGKKIIINNKSKVFTVYDGQVYIKVPLDRYSKSTHKIQLKIRENNAYKSSKSPLYTIKLSKKDYTRVIIDTPMKAKTSSTLSLRIYVTYNNQSILKTINKGYVNIKINNQNLTSNIKYGKTVINYKLPNKTGTYKINVNYKGIDELRDSGAFKNIIITSGAISSSESSILGNKNPKTERISMVNGVPNLVYMTNYMWADDEATYTLTKSQLQEVFKQDSYTLYLNKHMSKYVAFRTLNESEIYHVLKREKWNVIEKAVNKYLVKNNKQVLPNKITVSLKGKSYTYGEARAIQSTEFTCGPTSASVCSQALRNYVNEHTFAVEFKTYANRGTYARNINPSLKKHNMVGVNFYKNSFNNALNQLAGGGCSLIFYGEKHYVSIIDISKDKTKVLVSNSYGNYALGGGKIPNGWVPVSLMKKRFSSDSFGGLIVKLKYSLSSNTKNTVNNIYNNFGSGWTRKNTNEELNV